MAERILLLGITGVEKKRVIANLSSYIHSHHADITFLTYDLERDFILHSGMELHRYLNLKGRMQRSRWLDGWKRFSLAYARHNDKNILLCLHGVLVTSLNWAWSPIDVDCLRDFAPTRVITLIDDIYSHWYRIADFAKGAPYRGRLKLEQLLDARRKEIFLGDLIASNLDNRATHYVLPVRHPARTLFRILFTDPEKLMSIYLSFPITDPRALAVAGNNSGLREVNGFLRSANAFEEKHQNVICFCPVAVDELPLVHMLKGIKDTTTEIHFKREQRWSVRSFWSNEILLNDGHGTPKVISLPRKQVEDAAGLIKADVPLRDYRLIAQSKRLAVFNPWFNDLESKGVRNEIDKAKSSSIPVHIHQNPKHDTQNQAKNAFTVEHEVGALGDVPYSEYIVFHKSVKDLFSHLLK